MNVVRVKPGVEFTVIAPGGFRMLAALSEASHSCGLSNDIIITSACDGVHSGPEDPHKRGEAYDVRVKNLLPEEKIQLLDWLSADLGPRFYIFIEDPGTDNEHIHMQVRKGITYP